MKKLLRLAGAVMLLLALTACGQKPLDEQQLQQAVEACEDYAWMEAETTDFEVVKRQTNEDDKTDTAWVTIKGKADSFTVTRSYEVHSVLYNDGWKAEDVVAWYDPETPDSAVPLAGPSEEEIRNYVEWNMDMNAYRSFVYTYGGIGSVAYPAAAMGELTHPEEAVLEEGYASDTWYVDITYTYDIMEETATVPIYCYFDPVSMYWNMETGGGSSIARTVRLTDGLAGTWSGTFSNWQTGEDTQAVVTVSEVGDDWCQASILFDSNQYGHMTDSGRLKLAMDYYDDEDAQSSLGKLKLSWDWDDGKAHSLSTYYGGKPNFVLKTSGGTGANYILYYDDGTDIDAHEIWLEKSSSNTSEGGVAYTAPEALGTDPLTMIFALDGELYQLPAPFSAFEANGWEFAIEGEATDMIAPNAILPGGVYMLQKNNGDEMITVQLHNYSGDIAEAKDCYVVSVEADTTSGASLTIPEAVDNIELGTDWDEFYSIIETSEPSYYIYYTADDIPVYCNVYIDTLTEDGGEPEVAPNIYLAFDEYDGVLREIQLYYEPETLPY